MRVIRTTIMFVTLMSVAAALQLGGAAAAQANTTCKQYDRFVNESGTFANVQVCIAPAADYPNETGWARVVEKYKVRPDVCSFSLLPYDFDDPQPGMACAAVLPPAVQTWKAVGGAWKSRHNSNFTPGSKVWVAPYSAGWFWAWTQATGWHVIEAKHVAWRWYA